MDARRSVSAAHAGWCILAFLAALLPSVAMPATITVTSTGDAVAVDGSVTLREAIASINGGANINADVVAVGAYGTNDTIVFGIAGAGVHTIAPASALPTLTKPVVIDGSTQPGFAGPPLIELNGTSAGGAASGLTIGPAAAGSTVKSLAINRFANQGLDISATNVIQGNYIGTDPTGSIALPNLGEGVLVRGINNQIGGTAAGAGNVLSGNADGVFVAVGANNNTIQGNRVGTNPAGTAVVLQPLNTCSNCGTGIVLESTGNLVGGTVAGAGNIVGGNVSGVVMDVGGNTVQGNFIGTDATGTIDLRNIGDPGVRINNNSNNLIGGTVAGAGNVIAFNLFGGVSVQNFGGPATGNAVEGNSIYSNVGLGIDLSPNGGNTVIPNTPCGPHAGSNNLQNFPVLASATSSGGSTTIQGSLNSIASTTFRVELYASPACDASGFGEGKTFLAFTNVTTDGACNATLNVIVPVALTAGQVVTGTATDPGNNTSQFSACRVVSGAQPPSQPASSIPTLGDLALLALAVAVLTFGLGAIKRQS